MAGVRGIRLLIVTAAGVAPYTGLSRTAVLDRNDPRSGPEGVLSAKSEEYALVNSVHRSKQIDAVRENGVYTLDSLCEL
jgi:hypothetical protein